MISFAAFHRRGSENASRIELKSHGGVYLVVHCKLGAFILLPDARDVHNERLYFSAPTIHRPLYFKPFGIIKDSNKGVSGTRKGGEQDECQQTLWYLDVHLQKNHKNFKFGTYWLFSGESNAT